MIEPFIKYIPNTNSDYIIFDIGSRDCKQSIEFYNIFPNAKIYSFECNPNTLDICRRNIEPYKDRITLIEGAVCDYDGTIKFYPINQDKTITTWEDGNPGASSLYKSNGTYTLETYVQDEIEINCHRLDTIMHKYNIPVVDIIWINIQGAELVALKGLGFNLNNVKYINTKVLFKEIYTGQVMFNELNNYIKSFDFKIKNNLLYHKWQDSCIYEKYRKPVYIHVIGLEGQGHHFYMEFIDKLIENQYIYNKSYHCNRKNNTQSDILRKYFQDIYFKWNMYDKYNNNKSKIDLYNECINYIKNYCNNTIIFHGDSYPTLRFRTPDKNIDFEEVYTKLKDYIDIKYIFMHRNLQYTINSKKHLDNGIYNHGINMIDHLQWIRKKKLNIKTEDYIDLYYENINIIKLQTFLPFFNNIESIFNKIYKRSTKTISESDKSTIFNVYNEKKVFDILLLTNSDIITNQLNYIKHNIFTYNNIYIVNTGNNLINKSIINDYNILNKNLFPIINGITSYKLYASIVIPNILDNYIVIEEQIYKNIIVYNRIYIQELISKIEKVYNKKLYKVNHNIPEYKLYFNYMMKFHYNNIYYISK